jgi:hypothetical protein
MRRVKSALRSGRRQPHPVHPHLILSHALETGDQERQLNNFPISGHAVVVKWESYLSAILSKF